MKPNSPSTKPKKYRLAASDWTDAALATMARRGVANVRIERLARDLKVTKGSFYWHFKDRDALLDAMLERYKELSSAGAKLTEGTDSPGNPRQRIRDMLEAPATWPDAAEAARMELAIRLWARRSDHVRDMLHDLDQMRGRLLARLVAEVSGKAPDRRAKTQLLQALLFLLWTRDDLSAREREDLINLMLGVLERQ